MPPLGGNAEPDVLPSLAGRYAVADGVTQSLMGTWLSCRYKALLKMQGWESGATASYINFGTMFHELLALHHSSGVPRIESGIVNAFLDEKIKESGKNLGNIEEAEQHAAVCEMLYSQYVNYWLKDDAKRDWFGIESVFDVHFAGHRLRGARDGLFQYEGQNGVWVLESKTKSQLPSTLDTALTFDFQNLFYILATEIEIRDGKYTDKGIGKDTPVVGVLYNIIRTPGQKTSGRTPKDYAAYVQEDVESRPDHYFKRQEIPYPAEVRTRFMAELADRCCEFRKWACGGIPTYRNEFACIGRGSCEYMEHCASDTFHGFKQTYELFRELAR